MCQRKQSDSGTSHLLGAIVCVTLVLGFPGSQAIAEDLPPFCDLDRYDQAQRDIQVNPESQELRYQLRGEGYCEGLDLRPVTLPLELPFRLVSLRVDGLLPQMSDEVVEVRPVIELDTDVRVTIRSAYDFDIYRLDGLIPSGGQLSWNPNKVLGSNSDLSMEDLGFVGTIQHEGRDALIPVQVGAAGAVVLNASALEATIKPLIEARDLRWRFGEYRNGFCLPTRGEWRDVDNTLFSSNAPKRITITPPDKAFVCIEISGTNNNGAPVVSPGQLVFFPAAVEDG